jgi:hypothetical protein
MDTTPQDPAACDPFLPARTFFAETTDWLEGAAHDLAHADLEARLATRGAELLRRLFQAHLDQRAARERAALATTPPACGMVVRTRTRHLMTVFGRVQVARLAWARRDATGTAARCPLDRALSLPRETYSLGLRRVVAEHLRGHAGRGTVAGVDRATAGHVPVRQAWGLAARATQDFEAFYAQRPQPANDNAVAGALNVMSCDSKGIRMIPSALRDATRKARARAAVAVIRGDPTAVRSDRPHDRRMAVVTANWDQRPQPRRAAEILRELHRKPRRRPRTARPRPQHKRVAATIVRDLGPAITEMFAEAERRDPAHLRPLVALVDGADAQRDQIRAEAARRGRTLTLVLDLLHALHYLWLAAMALCRENRRAARDCVTTYLEKLLTRPVVDVIAGLRQSATLRHLTGARRAAVDQCADFLHKNAPLVDYPRFLREGLPIATGVIEGACRHLVQDRLGITGAQWDLVSAEAILRLRALDASGDWEAYWHFHLRQEHLRHYPPAA